VTVIVILRVLRIVDARAVTGAENADPSIDSWQAGAMRHSACC
jgi:hypothetical protein